VPEVHLPSMATTTISFWVNSSSIFFLIVSTRTTSGWIYYILRQCHANYKPHRGDMCM
jgi:hypothetical protein